MLEESKRSRTFIRLGAPALLVCAFLGACGPNEDATEEEGLAEESALIGEEESPLPVGTFELEAEGAVDYDPVAEDEEDPEAIPEGLPGVAEGETEVAEPALVP